MGTKAKYKLVNPLRIGIKYTLLGRDEDALQQLQTLQKRKIPRYVEAYTILLKSIIDGSQQQTQEWLEIAVKTISVFR